MSKINITEYNKKDQWVQLIDNKLYCGSCYSNKDGLFFKTVKENVCISCAVKEIKNGEFNKLIEFFPSEYVIDSFLETGSITSRLGILLNLDELESVILEMEGKNQKALLRSITLTLGFTIDHPLDLLIRTISLKLVVALEDLFLGILQDLVENCPGNSVQFDRQKFRYNLAHALSHINKHSDYVQDLIFDVLEEASARNDLFVKSWFSFENDQYSPLFPLEYSSSAINRYIDSYAIRRTDVIDNSNSSNNDKISVNTQTSETFLDILIDKNYTLTKLKALYSKYFCKLYEIAGEKPPFQWPDKKAKKSDFVRLFSCILGNSKLITAFLNKLESWERKVLEIIVFEEKNPLIHEIEKLYDVEIFTERDRERCSSYNCDQFISKKFPLFFYYAPYTYYSSELNPIVYLPLSLKEIFRNLLLQEDTLSLQGRNTFETDLFLSSSVDAVGQICNLATYIDQVGIKRGKNGKKILKASLKEVSESCGIEEPYTDDKKLLALKGTLLIELLDSKVLEMTDLQLSPEELYRDIFSCLLLREEGGVFNFFYFLDYLRLTGLREYKEDIDKRNLIEVLAVKTLLEKLPRGKWVTVENIIRFLNSKNILPYPYTIETNINMVEFKSQGEYGYETVDICEHNWGEAILHPYLKNILFILHAFGAVDLALEYPVNNSYQDKGNPWLSPYDGVREVSITPLGEWLAGRREDFGDVEKKSSTSITIDDKRLLITIKGKNPLVDITLNRIGESLGNSCYLVTASSFLSSCYSKKDLNDRIRMFRKNISSNPPPNWEEFFSSILRKAEPLSHKKVRRLVFRLEPEDKELIRLLFDDPIIKKLVMKAEDYHILIKEIDYKKIQKRLAEHGFLLPPKDKYV